jgi:hypothetical protein
MKLRFWVLFACAGLLLAWAVACPGSFAEPPGISQASSRSMLPAPALQALGTPVVGTPAPAHFGPQLFLLELGPNQTSALDRLPLVLHAQLTGAPDASRSAYLASGSPADAALAERDGFSLRLLDPDTTGQIYYLADATAAGAARAAAAAGRVLYADAAQLLVALPADQEVPRLVSLVGQGVAVSRVDPGPLVVERPLAIQAPRSPAVADPTIAALLAQITPAEISNDIADLSGERAVDLGGRSVTFHTRYLLAGHLPDVEEYLYRYYSSLGLATTYSYWAYGSYSGYNVIAEIPGTLHPERIWLIGGHYDSNATDTPYTLAPGADDNASGAAATMVIARLLAGHRFADTVRFVNFSAEEFGKWGSIYYAAAVRSAGQQVQGYLDLDMIGYDSNADNRMEVHTGTTVAASQALGTAFVSANSRYGQGLNVEVRGSNASSFSDHASFWSKSYPAVMIIEHYFDGTTPRDVNPNYHTSRDTLAHVNLDYVVRIARTSLVTFAELAGMEVLPTVTSTPSITMTPEATTTATLTPTPGDSPTPTDTPTPGGTPTPTLTPSPTVTPAQVCRELLSNGGFENDQSWIFTVTGSTAGYTTAIARTGLRSARFGLLPGQQAPAAAQAEPARTLYGALLPAAATISSGYQKVTIPADVDRVMLRIWYRPGTQAVTGDYERVLLLDPATYAVDRVLMTDLQNQDAWLTAVFDLTAYKGKSTVVYFEVYNDSTAATGRTWLYLDDVSLQGCSGLPIRPSIYLPLLLREPPE